MIEFNLELKEDGVEEGEGMEKIVFPSLDAWVGERFKDELKTLVMLNGEPGDRIRVQATLIEPKGKGGE